MLTNGKWFWCGTFLVLLLGTVSLMGCAAGGAGGGGGGEGEGEGEGEAGVSFSGVSGGNFAVAQDEDGNEYTFRQNDDGKLVEVNIRMADGGVTLKASLDEDGLPVKFRSSGGSHADIIYDGDDAEARYTAAGDEEGAARPISGLNSTSAKQRVLMRLAASNDKRAVAMQEEEEEIQALKRNLLEFATRTESLFDPVANPDSPLLGKLELELPARRIAQLATTADIREVSRAQLEVTLDEVPAELGLLAGGNFDLFDAEGFCIVAPGAEGGQLAVESSISFDANGILGFEIDRKFLFDLGLGSGTTRRTINWAANSPIPFTEDELAESPLLSATITPVFTGVLLDDFGRIALERRFRAVFEYELPVPGFTTDTGFTEQLFNAAFINGVLDGDILEFDMIVIDLAEDAPPLQLGRVRYHRQGSSVDPDDIQFPCVPIEGDTQEAFETGLKCPKAAVPWEPFTVSWETRGHGPMTGGDGECGEEGDPCAGDRDCCPPKVCMEGACGFLDDFDTHGFDTHGFDTHGFDTHGFDTHGFDTHGFDTNGRDGSAAKPHGAAQDMMPPPGPRGEPQFDWSVGGSDGQIVGDHMAPSTEVVGFEIGMLEVTLFVSFADVEQTFEVYTCRVPIGDADLTGVPVHCPEGSVQVGDAAFYSADIDRVGDDDWIEWFVPGTDAVDVFDPFATQTDIIFYEARDKPFQVTFAVFRADGSEQFGACTVQVVFGDFDICAELGWYEDGFCDIDICLHPDPDCQASDWCDAVGYYGDGICDPECPRLDQDCLDLDWCEELGWYGDGFCDPDCPRPDEDCENQDWCEANGLYGDDWCDPDCPRPDPDCTDDWCENLDWYGDGFCDPDCPRPDPDCENQDWCDELGYYGDGWCDIDCPRPDPDCTGDWCEDFGYYDDGLCDPDCPHQDPDCVETDWCEALGYYDDQFCDLDCPRPDPDCTGDWCDDLGYYGDGVCDPECPHQDSDCVDADWCEELGLYSDGWCDFGCPRPDPECTGDWCEDSGYYGDGFCDPDCPHFDPDCEVTDWCTDLGYYNDGFCDPDCPQLDPDCETDWCAELGWYGDGVCDPGCPQHDPDCDVIDWCEELGYYGDGFCDDCPMPDPDCPNGDVGTDGIG